MAHIPKKYLDDPLTKKSFRLWQRGVATKTGVYLPKIKKNGDRADLGTADELYVIAFDCTWTGHTNSVRPGKRYDHIGVICAYPPTKPREGGKPRIRIMISRLDHVVSQYSFRGEGMPSWWDTEKVADSGRDRLWKEDREAFTALWPGETLTMQKKDDERDEQAERLAQAQKRKAEKKQRLLPQAPAVPAPTPTPPVVPIRDAGARPKPEVLGPKTIAVNVNGVKVTGTPEDIRALLFTEE